MRCNIYTGMCCQISRRNSYPVAQCAMHRLIFWKIDDQTGCGLSGAHFFLQSPDGSMQSGCSDCQGKICFHIQPGIAYTLRETIAPPGYALLPNFYSITLDAHGRLQVNGEYTPGLAFANTRV